MNGDIQSTTIPEKLADWNIEILEKLMLIKSIEGESFDFKREDDKLYKDICAMANSAGGYLVLGVDEEKTNGILLGFKKHGFEEGEQDKVNQSIANSFHQVEPLPRFDIKHVTDKNKFYPVIKIELEESKKPFFIKDRGCYMRVGSSSKPASRSNILHLMQRHVVSREERRSHTNYLKPILEQLSALAVEVDFEQRLRLTVPDNYRNYKMNILTFFTSGLEQQYPYRFVNMFDVRHMDWVLSHLGSNEYSTIWQQFDKLHESVNVYNETVNKIFNDLDEQFTIELSQSYPDFIINDSQTYRTDEKSIKMKSLVRYFFLELKNSVHQSETPNFSEIKVLESHLPDIWYIGTESSSFMVARKENELDSSKLVEILTKKYEDEVLRAEFGKLKTEKEMHKLARQIGKDLESLTTDLEGGELIKGYCKLGF